MKKSQLSVTLSKRSITKYSTGSLSEAIFNPTCAWRAVKIVGPTGSAGRGLGSPPRLASPSPRFTNASHRWILRKFKLYIEHPGDSGLVHDRAV
jgi:hypothetical protein